MSEIIDDRARMLERCLDDAGHQVTGTNAFGVSADQRAVTTASVFLAAATAIAAVLIGWEPDPATAQAVNLSGWLTAGLFYIATVICLWTAFPRISFVRGNPPDFWQHHLRQNSSYDAAIEDQIGEYERKLNANIRALAKAARGFQAAVVLGTSAPLTGVLVYFFLDLSGR